MQINKLQKITGPGTGNKNMQSSQHYVDAFGKVIKAHALVKGDGDRQVEARSVLYVAGFTWSYCSALQWQSIRFKAFVSKCCLK